MQGLTLYQTQRLLFLAKKAGIKIDKPATHQIKFKRLEIKKVEDTMTKMYPEPVILVKKNGHSVRIFSIEGYKKLSCAGAQNLAKWHAQRKEPV